MMGRLYVIGIGFRPLDQEAKGMLLRADYVLVNKRLDDVFRRYDEYRQVEERIKLIDNVDETIEFIKSKIHRPESLIVLIAEGDPMFFGIGRRIVQELGRDNVEIIPDLSSIQVAFSRIKEPWGDAFLISLHGGPDPDRRRRLEYEVEDIPMLIERHHKLGILTDRVNTPSRIASIIQSSIANSKFSIQMYVCERLGYSDERIIEGTPESIKERSFSTPNVVIVLKRGDDK
jgi:precorrin-6Y C5,15-methyltransferase (decarboxylating)